MLRGNSGEFWKDRKVFITGSTGFKGSWLSLYLHVLGAKLQGYALAPKTEDDIFSTANISALCPTEFDDIRDYSCLEKTIRDFSPDVIFHMAAQPLVSEGYDDPVGTFSTNVIGTTHILEAARKLEGLKGLVVVATDKCYRNREWDKGYSEEDELGGVDPYSASKAAAEIVVESYRQSFFKAGNTGLASARGGNVIGGGDWSRDRLIPDMIKAFRSGTPLALRSPDATRPWQHVLDCVNGYVLLAEAVVRQPDKYSRAFNFGPDQKSERTVADMVAELRKHLDVDVQFGEKAFHEASRLALDVSLAREMLGWSSRLDFLDAVSFAGQWYKGYLAGENPQDLMRAQIDKFSGLAKVE